MHFIRWIALSKLRTTRFSPRIKFIRWIGTYPPDSDLSTFRTTGPWCRVSDRRHYYTEHYYTEHRQRGHGKRGQGKRGHGQRGHRKRGHYIV